MDQPNDNIMVALIPTDISWCKIDFPHVTLVYCGKIQNAKSFWRNELIKRVSSLSIITNPIYLKVSGVEVFGEEEKVDVLRLVSTPELLSMRTFLEEFDKGDFPVYKPHATIGPEGSVTNWNSQSTPQPTFLVFENIVISWGEEQLFFNLRKL